jgi:high-affinity iron transporter
MATLCEGEGQRRPFRRSGWFLFLLSFVVVYREVFETILFYAVWAEGNGAAMLAGAGAAAGLLALVAWIMLRYSARLPITQFFSWSSVLIAILAVVLAGKGIAGLQEAGILGVRPLVDVPRIEIWVSFRPGRACSRRSPPS